MVRRSVVVVRVVVVVRGRVTVLVVVVGVVVVIAETSLCTRHLANEFICFLVMPHCIVAFLVSPWHTNM